MKDVIKKETFLVGILTDPNYSPSLFASAYIQKVLNKEGIETIILSLEDIIKNRAECHTLFNVYYGEMGDGGIISGILDKNNRRFIGNDQYTCSLMFNKIISKIIFKQYGYLTPLFWYQPNVQKANRDLLDEIENLLAYPLFAKPVNGAASENICFIENAERLKEFIIKNRVFIDSGYYFFEQFIKGRELSAGYVNAIDELLPVAEIHLIKGKYQSNEAKFSTGLKENIVPSKIDPDVYKKAQMIARDLNYIFNCRTFSRMDMIYNEKDKKIYLLEINTNPGLLEKSLLPLLVKKSGVSETKFFLKLIQYSLNNN